MLAIAECIFLRAASGDLDLSLKALIVVRGGLLASLIHLGWLLGEGEHYLVFLVTAALTCFIHILSGSIGVWQLHILLFTPVAAVVSTCFQGLLRKGAMPIASLLVACNGIALLSWLFFQKFDLVQSDIWVQMTSVLLLSLGGAAKHRLPRIYISTIIGAVVIAAGFVRVGSIVTELNHRTIISGVVHLILLQLAFWVIRRGTNTH